MMLSVVPVSGSQTTELQDAPLTPWERAWASAAGVEWDADAIDGFRAGWEACERFGRYLSRREAFISTLPRGPVNVMRQWVDEWEAEHRL